VRLSYFYFHFLPSLTDDETRAYDRRVTDKLTIFVIGHNIFFAKSEIPFFIYYLLFTLHDNYELKTTAASISPCSKAN